MAEWKAEAIKLAETTNMSWSAIARKLGVATSTMTDNLRKHFKGYVSPSETKAKADDLTGGVPKILVFDIETSALLNNTFGLFNQNIGLSQIVEDWHLLSFGYKWLGDDSVHYLDIVSNTEIELLKKLQELFKEADFVIAHNGRRFDVKKIKARMVINSLPPIDSPRIIDTLEICRREFGFTSNRLEYLTHTLCKAYKKSGHEKFAGFELWKQFALGNKEAIQEMRDYCILDVQSLEELFLIVAPWDRRLPNFDLYQEEILDNSLWEESGYHYTNLGKYKKYRHRVTGQYRRGRTNLLSKEKRATLLANIA